MRTTRFGRPSLTTHAFALTAMMIAAVAGSPQVVHAQATDAPTTEEARTSQPFRFFWGVVTQSDQYRWHNARWAESIDLSSVAVSLDFTLFYQRYLGLANRAGYHMCQAPGYTAAHQAALATEIEHWIPDPEFDGFVCIEWEYAPFFWTGRSVNPVANDPAAIDRDYGDDWYEYMQENRSSELVGLTGIDLENYLKQTYEAASRAWFESTMAEFRRLRPNAKIGWYNLPNRTYLDYSMPGPMPAKAYNDSIPWFWEAVDFVVPSLYASAYTVESDSVVANFPNQNRPSENDRHLRSNIREAKRVAPDKLVVPILLATYVPPTTYAGQFLNDVNTRQVIDISYQEGCYGVILWDAMDSQAEADALESYLLSDFLPHIGPLINNPMRRADEQPPADPQDSGGTPEDPGAGAVADSGSGGTGSSAGAGSSGGGAGDAGAGAGTGTDPGSGSSGGSAGDTAGTGGSGGSGGSDPEVPIFVGVSNPGSGDSGSGSSGSGSSGSGSSGSSGSTGDTSGGSTGASPDSGSGSTDTGSTGGSTGGSGSSGSTGSTGGSGSSGSTGSTGGSAGSDSTGSTSGDSGAADPGAGGDSSSTGDTSNEVGGRSGGRSAAIIAVPSGDSGSSGSDSSSGSSSAGGSSTGSSAGDSSAGGSSGSSTGSSGSTGGSTAGDSGSTDSAGGDSSSAPIVNTRGGATGLRVATGLPVPVRVGGVRITSPVTRVIQRGGPARATSSAPASAASTQAAQAAQQTRSTRAAALSALRRNPTTASSARVSTVTRVLTRPSLAAQLEAERLRAAQAAQARADH